MEHMNTYETVSSYFKDEGKLKVDTPIRIVRVFKMCTNLFGNQVFT